MRPATAKQMAEALEALNLLRKARGSLARANCPMALESLRSTINSTEGAVRHMQRRIDASMRLAQRP